MTEHVEVHTGFVIMLGPGRRFKDWLFNSRGAAETTVAQLGFKDAVVRPAKFVLSGRRFRSGPEWYVDEGDGG